MTKNRKKIMAKIVASGMLATSIPIQTFANEIKDVIENVEEIVNNEETNNSDMENKTEIANLNELENENIINDEIDLNDFQSLDEISKIENSNLLDVENSKKNITTKEVEANKYIINTIDDLKQLREDINVDSLDTTGMIIELGADIDFIGETSWESIGTVYNKFKGTFDGKNYTIKNINIVGDFKGLFDYTENVVFENINFKDINIESTNKDSIGLIVGTAFYGLSAHNISMDNISLFSSSAYDMGSIVGNSVIGETKMSNIVFNGYLSNTSGDVGGLASQAYGEFLEIKIDGKIVGGKTIGGVIGNTMLPDKEIIFTIKNVDINANIEAVGSEVVYIGGIMGESWTTMYIENININNEYIGSKNGGLVGGIISGLTDIKRYDDIKILNININTKEMQGRTVGGIVGHSSTANSLTIENNNVYSDIKADSQAGGIVCDSASTLNLRNNTVKNTVIEGNDYAGGIIGTHNTLLSVNLYNNIVESNVISSKKASGIVNDMPGNEFANVVDNSFKGKIEVTSDDGKASGLSINWNASNSYISGNKIEAEITSTANQTGGLIGAMNGENSVIENNIVKAIIAGKDTVGGLIGYSGMPNITINNNDINVVITGNNTVGGLGGILIGKTVKDNKIVSMIKANDRVGGIVGDTANPVSIYSKNRVSTNITANSQIGGILGSGAPVQIDNNFIEGSILGKTQVGGLMGYMSGSESNFPTVKDSIIALDIKGDTLSNSVIGELIGPVDLSNVYYDTELTSLTDVYGIGLTTSQMQGKEALKNMNLDFETIWIPNKEFYPYFEQLNSAPDIIPNDKVVDLTITINQYDKFNTLDYITVEDFEGDEVTIAIKETIDTSKYGTFTITYVATDSKGLSGELTLNLKINPLMISLNNAPVIVVEDKVLTVGDEFNPLKMVVAHDKEDGIITDNIKIIENTVNMNKAGVYKVTYEVTDKDSAKTTKTIAVTVKEKAISNNNQSNSTTTDDKKDTNTDNTQKPQTSDMGLRGLSGMLISTIGLCSINRKKE